MSSRWQPAETLKAINTFIAETSAVSAKQIYLLALARTLISDELYTETDSKLESDIAENVTLLSQLCMNLQDQGVIIQVKHPESGQVAELAGIAYSTESISYQAGVKESGRLATWPLFDGAQIRIIN
jgi:hypothetical protein